ncbi:hypothetical protein GCM10023091_38210 [Ravibacter arvi]|uniref:Uncharacterized protein n=1 Tax=Ravibacter arvi TaxID=2051041 RepID=A0ABP8M9R6_9BACT
MKNAKLKVATALMAALFLTSFASEAKNNYFNIADKNEEKVKTHGVAAFMPVVSTEETPSFPSYRAAGFTEKYTPTQLNKLMGVWPDREQTNREPGNESKFSVEPADTTQAADRVYSPEQFADLLGISF